MAAETVLHSFVPYPLGSSPQASVCLGPGNNLYGTALGGPTNNGVVFSVRNTGQGTVLHSFTGGNDGAYPVANLICKSAGQIYGTAAFGGSSGAGVVFRVKGEGQQEILYSFTGGNDGGYPFAGLIQDSAGNLYGTAQGGGPSGAGVVFKLDTKATETVLYGFTGGDDGGYPAAGVVFDSGGNLYGTALYGGSAGAGVVFKLDTKGNETVLYSFTGGNDGGYPSAGVVFDSAGNLYGTTNSGGQSGAGVVFKLDAKGNETVLYSFTGGNDGGYPYAGVVLDSAGNLYGTTPYGGPSGAGVVFKLDTKSNETVLYSFTGGNDGGYPNAGLILGGDGNLYGAAGGGGPAGGGVLFKIDMAGHEAILYSFPCLDGFNNEGSVDTSNSPGSLIQDSNGNLYGTMPFGGAANAGIVYKVTPGGTESILYNFTGGADGANPFAGVVMDAAGNLYGTTNNGGAAGAGVVYKLDTDGHETVLHTFSCLGCPADDGKFPNGAVILNAAGNLYGTTREGGSVGYGTVYRLDPLGHETVLHSFTNDPDGANPTASVTMDSAGILYGVTAWGGTPGRYGTKLGVAYKLDTANQETVLYSFCRLGDPHGDPLGCQDGALPLGGVALDPAGNLYGGSFDGGPKKTDRPGVVYRVDPAGHETVLYAFQGTTDGNGVRGSVILDSDGNVYGTTEFGGGSDPYWPFGNGVVFEVSPSGQETVLYAFMGGADGAWPSAGPVRDSAGNLYGTTQYGGTAGAGVVYKVTPGAPAEFPSAASSLQPLLKAGRPTSPGCVLPHAPHHLACPSSVPSKEQIFGPPSRP